jgi:hypothetical protein
MVVAPLIAMLLTAPSARLPKTSEGTRLEVGTRLFNSGDFEAALRALDAAALEGGDAATLERVHLLRAQCYAARQDFARAEEAFTLALDANPEATLDPGRVDPTVVRVLDSVRARLTGTVVLSSTPSGATVLVDGTARGVAPLSLSLGVGRHRLEAKWGEGEPPALTEVQVRPRREVRVEWVQGAPKLVPMNDGPEGRKLGPTGEFRFAPEFSTFLNADPTLPLELSGGVEFSYFRATMGVRLYPNFGLTPRFTFALPVMTMLGVVIEAGVPFELFPSVALGISGGAGVEYYPVRWFSGFVLLGGRHYFLLTRSNDSTALTATIGVRLRMPN